MLYFVFLLELVLGVSLSENCALLAIYGKRDASIIQRGSVSALSIMPWSVMVCIAWEQT